MNLIKKESKLPLTQARVFFEVFSNEKTIVHILHWQLSSLFPNFQSFHHWNFGIHRAILN